MQTMGQLAFVLFFKQLVSVSAFSLERQITLSSMQTIDMKALLWLPSVLPIRRTIIPLCLISHKVVCSLYTLSLQYVIFELIFQQFVWYVPQSVHLDGNERKCFHICSTGTVAVLLLVFTVLSSTDLDLVEESFQVVLYRLEALCRRVKVRFLLLSKWISRTFAYCISHHGVKLGESLAVYKYTIWI